MSNKTENEQREFRRSQKRGLVPKLRFPEFRGAGAWDEKKLADVLSPAIREVAKPSSIYLALGIRSHGKGTFHKPNQAPEKNSMDRLYLVHRDDLIVNITFAWEGAIAIANDKDHGSHVSHRFPTYVFIASASMPDFFRYVIASKAFIYKLGLISPGGAGRNRVMNKKDFLKLSVLLPSLQEQQKIADCLTSLDELITLEAQKLDTLKTHKKGLMQQLFPAEGETLPKLRFREFRDAGEWEMKRLEDFATIVRGGSPRPIDEYIANSPNGLNWLKIGDIDKESKYVTCTQEKVIPAALNKTRVVSPGDLILSNSMSFGRPYILEIKTCIHDGWIAVSEIDKNLDRDYLYYLMMTSGSQTYFSNNAAGSGVQNLNADIIKLLPVSYPRKKEQQKIASCLASLDDIITAQTKKLTALKTHKKGLMQQLFPELDEVSA